MRFLKYYISNLFNIAFILILCCGFISHFLSGRCITNQSFLVFCNSTKAPSGPPAAFPCIPVSSAISSAVKSLRHSGDKVLTDERILGTDDFVERVLGETDRRARRLFSSQLRDKEVQQLIEERCKKEGISTRELQLGSRRGVIPGIRSDLALNLARERGLPLAEIARQLGVSTSAISQILRRRLNT